MVNNIFNNVKMFTPDNEQAHYGAVNVLIYFNFEQIRAVNETAAMAEDLVSNYFKISTSQWLRQKYDIKTLSDLTDEEIVYGPFAQIIRYEGQQKNTSLRSASYYFYKICIQDHSILTILEKSPEMSLASFLLYIISHELIHIVRFVKFLQGFDASSQEKIAEETRVHKITHKILAPIHAPNMSAVFRFYRNWRKPIEKLTSPA